MLSLDPGRADVLQGALDDLLQRDAVQRQGTAALPLSGHSRLRRTPTRTFPLTAQYNAQGSAGVSLDCSHRSVRCLGAPIIPSTALLKGTHTCSSLQPRVSPTRLAALPFRRTPAETFPLTAHSLPLTGVQDSEIYTWARTLHLEAKSQKALRAQPRTALRTTRRTHTDTHARAFQSNTPNVRNAPKKRTRKQINR